MSDSGQTIPSTWERRADAFVAALQRNAMDNPEWVLAQLLENAFNEGREYAKRYDDVAPPLTAGPVAPPPESDVFDLAALLLKEAGYHASYRVFQASVEALRAARPPASPPALEALIAKWREQSKAKRHIARDDIEDGIWTYQHEAMGASGAHAADADELEAALNALAVPPEAPPR